MDRGRGGQTGKNRPSEKGTDRWERERQRENILVDRYRDRDQQTNTEKWKHIKRDG